MNIPITQDTVQDLYKVYMETDDPTEYSVAKFVGSWTEWETLCNIPWFKPFILQWRKELDIKIKSKALRALREVACGDTRDAFVANRYLLDGNWKVDKKTKGRPSKADIAMEASRIAYDEDRLKEDFKLIKRFVAV